MTDTSDLTDTYSIYAAWFQHHYGRPYDVDRETFNSWCRRPRLERRLSEAQRHLQADIDTERREGWAYDR